MHWPSRVALLLAAVSAVVVSGVAIPEPVPSYDGYVVIRVIPQTVGHLNALAGASENLNYDFDFWKAPSTLGRTVDIMSPPHRAFALRSYLRASGMQPTNMIEDVGELVARDAAEVAAYKPFVAGQDASAFNFFEYHSYDSIVAYLQSLPTTYPSLVTLGSLGKSHQGREQYYVKIGLTSTAKKPAIYIDAGIHAREWIAPAVALYTIGQLTANSSAYTSLLQKADVYIAPEINPDGYEFSRTSNRLWRKSRSGPRSGCYGVDINRNFPYKWGVSGYSTNPCSDTYNGPSALSEVEGQNVANFLNANNNTIQLYLTLHSYGQYILYPWGYATHTYPTNVNQLKSLGTAMYNAEYAVYKNKYTVGNSADALYPASGASDDYGKSVGVPYVYTVELRPTESSMYGFQLPASQIQATSQEIFPAFLVAFNTAISSS